MKVRITFSITAEVEAEQHYEEKTVALGVPGIEAIEHHEMKSYDSIKEFADHMDNDFGGSNPEWTITVEEIK